MKGKHIATIVAAVTILAVSGILVAIGVSRHTETGVMGACWIEGHVARYEAEGAKECEELIWSQEYIPLFVYAKGSNPYSTYSPMAATTTAMRYINAMLGWDAFVWAGDRTPDVEVAIDVPYDSTWTCPGGRTRHERDSSGVMRAYVETSNTSDIMELNAVLVHELLHALGLGHDDWEGSIMYVNTRIDGGGSPYGRLWITDHDRKLLTSLYAPR